MDIVAILGMVAITTLINSMVIVIAVNKLNKLESRINAIEYRKAIMNNLQFLSNITLDTLRIQSYTETDHLGYFAITQDTCIDRYVLLSDCITLTRDQVKELMISMQQYLGE